MVDKWVFKKITRWRPQSWIFDETLRYKVLKIQAEFSFKFRRLPFSNCFHRLEGFYVLIWNFSSSYVNSCNPQSPDVNFLVVLFRAQHFRSHPIRSTNKWLSICLRFAKFSTYSKVSNFHFFFVCQKNIRWLNVSMDFSCWMQILYTLQNFSQNDWYVELFQLSPCNQVFQSTSTAVFHHNKQLHFMKKRLIKAYNVRMGWRFEEPNFSFNTLDHSIAFSFKINLLDCNNFRSFLVKTLN